MKTLTKEVEQLLRKGLRQAVLENKKEVAMFFRRQLNLVK